MTRCRYLLLPLVLASPLPCRPRHQTKMRRSLELLCEARAELQVSCVCLSLWSLTVAWAMPVLASANSHCALYPSARWDCLATYLSRHPSPPLSLVIVRFQDSDILLDAAFTIKAIPTSTHVCMELPFLKFLF